MRLIDADALKELIVSNVYPIADAFNSRDYGMFWTGGIEKAIDEMPSIDAVPVVRCKDCKYAYITNDGECKYCDIWFPVEAKYLDGDYYCASAERKES